MEEQNTDVIDNVCSSDGIYTINVEIYMPVITRFTFVLWS